MVFWGEAYLSALLRYGVFDTSERYVGRLDDIVVDPQARFPEVTHIAVRPKGSRETVLYPWSAVRSASQEGIRLQPNASGSSAEPAEQVIHLRRDLMDRQIVDTSGKRVVRVHDLKLGGVGGKVLLTHADIGWRGVLRRMGWEHFALGMCRTFRVKFGERLIAWEHLHAPQTEDRLIADQTREALRRIHPADLADIAEELSAPDRAAFLEGLDEDIAADAMQEMDPVALVAAVNELDDEHASELIDEMDPDAGADLLADLSEERANKLLELMEPKEAQELRHLLTYAEDSAGGLMTCDHVTVPRGITVQAAVSHIRERFSEVETVYYVYVVDDDDLLCGVLTLRDLIVAGPDGLVDDLMAANVVSATTDMGQVDIARLIARYNLLALPVVDAGGHLRGIVTADDAIDAVIPTSVKKRIPKVFAR